MIYLMLMVFSMLLCLNNAYSATYWVAKTGSDSRSCTQAQSESMPKLTIRSALSCLSAGSTLVVKAGTYHEETLRLPGGTSWTSPVTIMAKPGGTVVIDATSAIDILLDLTYATSSYIIIDGFILDATNAAYGLWIEHAHHVRIKNSEVKNAKNVGIALYGAPGSQYVELLNLNVHGNGFTPSNPQIPGHGVYCTSHDNIIDGGSYHGNHGHGVHVYLSPSVGKGAPDRNIVRNIRAYGNGGPGVGIYFGKGNQVYNNLIYNNGGGLRVSAYNTLVANNTVYGNGPYYGILIDKPGNTVKNNIAYQNASGNIDSQVANTLSNNLTTDPNFVNAAAGDFRLQAGSPAINAGVTIREVTTDFDKRPRPQGTNFDLGAYEYTDGPGIARPRPRMNKR